MTPSSQVFGPWGLTGWGVWGVLDRTLSSLSNWFLLCLPLLSSLSLGLRETCWRAGDRVRGKGSGWKAPHLPPLCHSVQNSRYQTYQRMWNYMQSKQPSVFVKSTEEGIARVLNSRYAFLLESTMNEYHRRLNCNLTQIGGLLDTKGYGIGMPLGMWWQDWGLGKQAGDRLGLPQGLLAMGPWAGDVTFLSLCALNL